jgi:hypothetical protein
MRTATKISMAALLVGGALSIASAAHADELIDTVFLANGGRVRGSVMVDDAKVVSVRLADGKTKEIARSEVMRVEYAATASTAVSAETVSKPKTRTDAEQEDADDSEAAPPPARKRRKHDTTDTAGGTAEQRADDEAARQRRLTGARRMIGAGATLTAIGWAAVLGGLVAVGFGAANGDGGPIFGGALVTGFSLPLGITGSVLLSIGVRQKRKNAAPAFAPEETAWVPATDLALPRFEVPPLSFTVSF